MNRRQFLRSAAAIALTSTLTRGSTGAGSKRPPNIILILADDLGYGDLGCYGQKKIKTPRLDAMAAEGMRFTHYYAASACCSPSRCGLYTGLHTGHCSVRNNGQEPILPTDVTFVKVLKDAGYATAGVGKWGLTKKGPGEGMPAQHGFDWFYGFLDNGHAHTHYPDFVYRNDKREEIPGTAGGKRGVWVHDLFRDEAMKFIRQKKDQPFFFMYATTIPHADIIAPADAMKQYEGQFPEKPFDGKGYVKQPTPNAARAAMITRMDSDIGAVLDLLKELKIDDNTLVLFASDNGPAGAGGSDPVFFNSSGGLKGLKFGLSEGGIRDPLIARWPGTIPAGKTSDLPCAAWDFMATFAELAGATAPKTDGVSILPTLKSADGQMPRDYLYWELRGSWALRQGDWKAMGKLGEKTAALYDLKADPAESRNVAEAQADIAARLGDLAARAHTPPTASL